MGSFNARTLININSGRLFAKEKETVGIESNITSASTQQLDRACEKKSVNLKPSVVEYN